MGSRTTLSQTEKGQTLRALHERPGAFIIPNPWDAGSARILEHLGFEALATTSAGSAFARGKRDSTLSREETFADLAAIAAATGLPVSADLGNCFGDDPKVVAETIRLAAVTGIVGGSVEDATGREDGPIYCFEHAVARVRAAAEAAHSLPLPFTLTARA
ncbi:MAG TPA: isocitrate lyase/phosphoenolpyruvate mutase family protein, partial [Terriglobales bacterium]|nr:isocitrate lyase/phosphoenolpyruvate mutase family protein [Terriglobales bacterium]